MQARVLRGEEFAVDVGDRNCLVVDLHGRDRPRRDVLDTGDVAELNLGHLDEGNNPAPALRGIDRECYPRLVATILLAGVDLYFRGKLEGLLPGYHLVTVDSVDPPDLVIADIARIDPDEVADAYPEVPILGFTNHTDTSGLRRAHEAGFDQVVAKSALTERAKDLVEELTG